MQFKAENRNLNFEFQFSIIKIEVEKKSLMSKPVTVNHKGCFISFILVIVACSTYR